ncbi:hypothetical protein HZS_4390 [Henneguya salminicola]|nr:hypothetical protein HZS_4390 [Henneguya salminicola]
MIWLTYKIENIWCFDKRKNEKMFHLGSICFYLLLEHRGENSSLSIMCEKLINNLLPQHNLQEDSKSRY